MRSHDNRLGFIYMLIGMSTFAAVDTMAKVLTETLHPQQIVWSRMMGLFVGISLWIGLRGLQVLRTNHPKLQVARGASAACSATLFIMGVGLIPLADAIAVTFVAPFMVTLMAAAILREPVGLRRWLAVLVGFGGAMVVIRPGFGEFNIGVVYLIAATFFFALRQILSRLIGTDDRTETTVAYTAIISVALLTVPLPFVWQTPVWGTQSVLLVAIAVLAAFGETMVIKALETAQAVVIAPVQYLLIIWATFYGYTVFGDFPDVLTWVGTAIIVASGLYTFARERRRS